MHLSSVLLPDPLWPSSPTVVPASMSRVMSSSAVNGS